MGIRRRKGRQISANDRLISPKNPGLMVVEKVNRGDPENGAN